MSKKRSRIFFRLIFSALILLSGLAAEAQFRQIPLEQHPAKTPKQASSLRSKMAPGDTLRLPFWDDFSFTGTEPRDSLWANSANVAITNGLAVLPPSVNAATFDGIDSLGRPYKQDPTLSGEADVLLSKPINLGPAEISDAEKASVFLSFYWQLQGRGERPDSGDSLKLFFLDADSVWHQVWQKGGSADIDSAAFKQELTGLLAEGNARKTGNPDNPEETVNFFHEGFRFKFTSFNRQSGMFDLWHIDYVLVDKNRNDQNFYYKDRTLSDVYPSLFQPYTAIPVEQFFAATESYISPLVRFTAYNHESPEMTDNPRYNMLVFDGGKNLITKLADSAIIQMGLTGLQGQKHLTMEVSGITAETLQPYARLDSLYLETVTHLHFLDERPFFQANDTIAFKNVLHDYFAYDDGTAEYAVELGGGRGLRMAYEFELQVQDTLTHLQLYIPFYLTGSGGQFMDLKVWRKLAFSEAEEDSLVYTFRDVPVTNSQNINQFNSYEFPFPVVLPAGTFYVGIEKLSDQFLAIGFDRNTNNREKVYVSTNQETWFEGLEEEGSLMIRPRFARTDPTVLGSRDHELSFPVNIYPNPSKGIFTVGAEQEIKAVQIFSSHGHLMRTLELPPGGNRKEVNSGYLPNGFYLVKLIFKNGTSYKKIIIKN